MTVMPVRRKEMTPMEKRVLSLVCEGYTNHEIAAEVGISHHTVVAHMRRICWILGARNRTHAVAIFSRNGRATT